MHAAAGLTGCEAVSGLTSNERAPVWILAMLKSGLGEDSHVITAADLPYYSSGMYESPGILQGTWLPRHGDPTMWVNTLLGSNNHPWPIVLQISPLQNLVKLCLRTSIAVTGVLASGRRSYVLVGLHGQTPLEAPEERRRLYVSCVVCHV